MSACDGRSVGSSGGFHGGNGAGVGAGAGGGVDPGGGAGGPADGDRRAHAGDGGHGAGAVGGLDRDAEHHRRAARAGCLLVGDVGLPADGDGHDADLRQAGRPVGTQARAPVRPGPLRARLDALGDGHEHAGPDRDAGRPGTGGGGGRADRPDDDRRPVHARGAREGPGALQRDLGGLERGGAGVGGRPDRPALLAMGLLRQRAVRRPLGLDPGASRRRGARASRGPADRLVGRGAADGGLDGPARGGHAGERAIDGPRGGVARDGIGAVRPA